MDSTISSKHGIAVKLSGNCQGIGICINGSKDVFLSYIDPGYCKETIDCPRNWISSSIHSSITYFVYDFQSVSVPRGIVVPNDYQRPALAK